MYVRGRGTRILYAAIGVVCVGLGVLGAILPVLPTTPFLLVALWAFSRGSTRLERWLLHHPRFGPRLVAWRENAVIPLAVKLTAWISMAASLTAMVLVGASPIAIVGAASVMAIGAVYIALRPSRPPPRLASAGAVDDREIGGG